MENPPGWGGGRGAPRGGFSRVFRHMKCQQLTPPRGGIPTWVGGGRVGAPGGGFSHIYSKRHQLTSPPREGPFLLGRGQEESPPPPGTAAPARRRPSVANSPKRGQADQPAEVPIPEAGTVLGDCKVRPAGLWAPRTFEPVNTCPAKQMPSSSKLWTLQGCACWTTP